MGDSWQRDVFRAAAQHHRRRGYLLLITIVLLLTLFTAWCICGSVGTHTIIVPGAADSRHIPVHFLP